MQQPLVKLLPDNFKWQMNLSLVLDRSGSMAGQPLKYAIAAAEKLVEYLTPEDILSVVIGDGASNLIMRI